MTGPAKNEAVRRSIVGCARCHGPGHEDLLFEALAYPMAMSDSEGPLTHWASCPVNGHPILARFTEPKP